MERTRSRRILGLRDFHLFVMTSPVLLVVWYLASLTSPETLKVIQAYGWMYVGSLGGIIFYVLYYGKPEIDTVYRIDFDEDITKNGILWLGLGLALVFAAAFFFGGSIKRQLFYIPTISLAAAPLDETGKGIMQLLWQIFNVSYGEEMLKLVFTLALTRRFSFLSHPLDEIVGAGVPIGVWAYMHTILAYGQNYVMVAGAVAAGIIFYIQIKKSQSILVPIFTHGIYNTLVTAVALGLIVVPVGF